MSARRPQSVTAQAPAKINLVLRVGPPDATGYHPLVTVFQALSWFDEVTVRESSSDRLTIGGDGDLSGVPTDTTNIVWAAADALAARIGHRTPLDIHINKTIPVAGGMAGGSANAAATLVALNELWQGGMDLGALEAVASEVGADVPFSLRGGLCVGEGRGDQLTSYPRSHDLHVVVVASRLQLSTPRIYQRLDTLREGRVVALPEVSDSAISEVLTADGEQLARLMANDLEEAALHEAPELRDTLSAMVDAGAYASMVSGSGPTVWGVCKSAVHASDVASTLQQRGLDARAVVTTPLGAHVTSSLSSPMEGH